MTNSRSITGTGFNIFNLTGQLKFRFSFLKSNDSVFTYLESKSFPYDEFKAELLSSVAIKKFLLIFDYFQQNSQIRVKLVKMTIFEISIKSNLDIE